MDPKPKRHLAGAAEFWPMWDKPDGLDRHLGPPQVPTLRLTPYAWSKLIALQQMAEREIGGLGIRGDKDVFLIEDVRLMWQRFPDSPVEFDEEGGADFCEEQSALGQAPERWARCAIQILPKQPATLGKRTAEIFPHVMGDGDWSVLVVLAPSGDIQARLKFACGPGAELNIPVQTAWEIPFFRADPEVWRKEYSECVSRSARRKRGNQTQKGSPCSS